MVELEDEDIIFMDNQCGLTFTVSHPVEDRLRRQKRKRSDGQACTSDEDDFMQELQRLSIPPGLASRGAEPHFIKDDAIGDEDDEPLAPRSLMPLRSWTRCHLPNRIL